MVRQAAGEVEVGVELVVGPQLRRHLDLVVGDVRTVGEDVVPSKGVGAVEVDVGPSPQSQLLGGLDLPHVHQDVGDVYPLDAWQHFLGLVELGLIELSVDADSRPLDAVLLEPFQHELEEVHGVALLYLPLIGETTIGVQIVEVHSTAAEPPRLDDVAIEAGVEEPGVGVVPIHEGGLWALGRCVPVACQVDDVEAVANHEGLDVPFG